MRIKEMWRLQVLVGLFFVSTGCASQPAQSANKPGPHTTPDGTVCFHFTIMPDGTVADAEIYESRPAGVFESEARRTLQKWKFKPPIVDGKPVAQPGAKYCLDFKLDETPVSVK